MKGYRSPYLLHPERTHDVNKSPLVISPFFSFFLPAVPADKDERAVVRELIHIKGY